MMWDEGGKRQDLPKMEIRGACRPIVKIGRDNGISAQSFRFTARCLFRCCMACLLASWNSSSAGPCATKRRHEILLVSHEYQKTCLCGSRSKSWMLAASTQACFKQDVDAGADDGDLIMRAASR